MFPNADAKARFRNAALPLKHDPIRANNFFCEGQGRAELARGGIGRV
jgi:hypothetical protein